MARLVSTVIPVYNRPTQLLEAVESVVAQTYRPIEIIIVDDGSTDATARTIDDIVAQHGRAPELSIACLRQSNGGPGLAREAGRKRANGDFIQYLDSDDVLLPRKFEWQVAWLEQHANCQLALGLTQVRDAEGRLRTHSVNQRLEGAYPFAPMVFVSRWWGTSTVLYRRATCDGAGPWTDLALFEDWDYECRIGAAGASYYFAPQYVAEVRKHADGRLDDARQHDRKHWLACYSQAHQRICGYALARPSLRQQPEWIEFVHNLLRITEQCDREGLYRDAATVLRLAVQSCRGIRTPGLYWLIARSASRLLRGRVSSSLRLGVSTRHDRRDAPPAEIDPL